MQKTTINAKTLAGVYTDSLLNMKINKKIE